jgi:hypothetical protein
MGEWPRHGRYRFGWPQDRRQVTRSVRRIRIVMASACPNADIFGLADDYAADPAKSVRKPAAATP